MSEWDLFVIYGVFLAGAVALAGWATWLNRDLMKPQLKRHDHTPAE